MNLRTEQYKLSKIKHRKRMIKNNNKWSFSDCDTTSSSATGSTEVSRKGIKTFEEIMIDHSEVFQEFESCIHSFNK